VKRCKLSRPQDLFDVIEISVNRGSISEGFRISCTFSCAILLHGGVGVAAMKKSSTVFLQIVIVLIGIGTLALLLWEPHIEGRNAHATLFEIYFKDPFLAYAYLASTPFFVALYQAFKVLGYIGQDKAFSQATLKALRTIKFCALAIIGFVALGELFIMLGNSDDRAGGVFMGILITFGSAVIATAAVVFERVLQSAVDIKSENEFK
jgi:hypothetical protein